MLVVRRKLIRPDRLARLRTAREQRRAPLVVAGANLGVPRPRIRRAVVNEVELRVVRDPAPHAGAADLPLIARPARYAEVFAAIESVERFEVPADEYILIRPGVVGGPRDLARCGVKRLDPSAHAELAAAHADEHVPLYDERRHRDGFTDVDVADLRHPLLFARRRIERDGARIERIEEHPATIDDEAPIHDIATRDALGRVHRMRLIRPFGGEALLRQVQRIHEVRKGRDNVHRVAGDNGSGFMSTRDSGGESRHHAEALHILIVDFRERAEARALEILRRPHPFAIIGEPRRGITARRCRSCPRRLRHARRIFAGISFTGSDQRTRRRDRAG